VEDIGSPRRTEHKIVQDAEDQSEDLSRRRTPFRNHSAHHTEVRLRKPKPSPLNSRTRRTQAKRVSFLARVIKKEMGKNID